MSRRKVVDVPAVPWWLRGQATAPWVPIQGPPARSEAAAAKWRARVVVFGIYVRAVVETVAVWLVPIAAVIAVVALARRAAMFR